MRFGPRLMRRKCAPSTNQAEEVTALRQALVTCPGVGVVHSIEAHRKGGYVAVVDFSMDHLDAFISHMDREGWMNVF
jgi:hypothetical protein